MRIVDRRKIRADAKLKLMPTAVQEQLAELFKEPGFTLKQASEWLRQKKNLKLSVNTISEWYSWYQMRRAMAEREAKIDALLFDIKKQHPEISDAELFAKGQRVFSLLAVAEQQADEWVKVQALALEREKLAEKLKTDRERALDALAAEVKGNEPATAALKALVEALGKP
jgi:pyruvate-formate lyase-activating enzyme